MIVSVNLTRSFWGLPCRDQVSFTLEAKEAVLSTADRKDPIR